MTPTADGATSPDQRPWAAPVAWTAVVAYALVIGATLWFGIHSHGQHAPPDVGLLTWNTVNVLIGAVFATFVVAGALIIARRPGNTVGWVMVGGGLAFALWGLGDTYGLVAIGASPGDPPTVGILVKLIGIAASRLGAVLVAVFLPLVYPDGRLPTARWRPLAWAAWVFVAVWTVSGVASARLTGVGFPLGREPIEVYEVANPLATAWLRPVVAGISGAVEYVLILGFAVAAVGAVVVRFRRSRGVERQQMKWFAFAACLYVALFGASIVLSQALDVPPALVQTSQGLAYVALAAYPAAVGMAVLRYRLYEIDRLISRTVSYGLVVAVLGAVYVGVVVGLGAAVTAVTGGGGSDLVVALATLAVAGLFGPVRSRVQSAVDRRFNRTGFEARRAVEAFTHEVRDEVDLASTRERTAETAAVAVQPTHVSVWLTDTEEPRVR